MKNKLTILVFFMIIFGLFFLNIIVPDEVISKSECVSLTALAINGHDIRATSREGKQIGEALAILLEAVMDGKVENERQALLRYLDSIGSQTSS